jgi:hypothetical protein
VASSCASRLRSSGLSIVASAWSRFTTSPATTDSVTVPAAMVYSVGLFAEITRPSAERSRTRSPRVTSAMRTRSPSIERPPLRQAVTTAAPTAVRARRWRRGGGPGRRCRGCS